MTIDHPMRARGDGTHRCPVCNVFMWTWDTGAVPPVLVERCQRCDGILLSQEQLDQLDESMWVNLRELPNAPHATSRKLACPTCTAPMMTSVWPGPPPVELDWCSRCQVFWLDGAELDGVRELVRQRHDAELNGMLEHMELLPSPDSKHTPLDKELHAPKTKPAWERLFSLFARKRSTRP